MKKLIMIISLLHISYTLGNEDLHRKLQLKAKVLQGQIQEAISQLQHKIDNKICENEEERLELVLQFVYQWKTNRVNIFQPVVLEASSENSYLHTIKNIMYITSILGANSIERMQEQAQHLVDTKTAFQFVDRYRNQNFDAIIIAPEHRKISTIKRCPITLYKSNSSDFHETINFIQKHEHCCASFIVNQHEHFYGIIIYKTQGTYYYIITDPANKTHFEDQELLTIISTLQPKEIK